MLKLDGWRESVGVQAEIDLASTWDSQFGSWTRRQQRWCGEESAMTCVHHEKTPHTRRGVRGGLPRSTAFRLLRAEDLVLVRRHHEHQRAAAVPIDLNLVPDAGSAP